MKYLIVIVIMFTGCLLDQPAQDPVNIYQGDYVRAEVSEFFTRMDSIHVLDISNDDYNILYYSYFIQILNHKTNELETVNAVDLGLMQFIDADSPIFKINRYAIIAFFDDHIQPIKLIIRVQYN